MEILKSDMKEKAVTVRANNMDDLWHLKHVIELDDRVRMLTTRKVVVKRGKEIEEGKREKMMLTVLVEKISLDSQLDLGGKIIEGPENIEHAHHTLHVEPGSVLTIQKPTWKKYQLDRLNKAKVKKKLLLVCVLDREQADFASLSEAGIEMLTSIFPKSPEDTDREDYYKELLKYLEGKKDYATIVLAGPGFERENLLKFIKDNSQDLAKKIFLEHTSDIGKPGVQEVIKKSANKILKDTRVAEEGSLVEEFLKRISTRGLVVYGKRETEEAVNLGAVETLLISTEKIRENEKLMEQVEKLSGKVSIITNDHDLGEQFLQLGGVGAFLRFKIK
ncbi:MAG: mRNA surveillance protein pelota [Candidatus Aenigmarchaeota archaeon]|nr:mRNA surveillance protein pelota [Candidatus Aenigmarchaeota archaeon]